MLFLSSFVHDACTMNYLAHAYLSGDNEEIIIGNFIADHIKGRPDHRFAGAIMDGIRLHWYIDEFTDSHPVVKQSVERLKPVYKRYSTVIVDLYYDHFLASNWKNYSNIPLKRFTRRIYRIMLKHYRILPAKTRRILPFMMADDWLAGYGRPQGIKLALSGMARRTRFESGMQNAVNELYQEYDLFKGEFQAFFPSVIESTEQFRTQLNNTPLPEKTLS